MINPTAEDAITKTIVVNCTVAAAFRIWTEQIKTWWPQGHSLSGHPDTTVFIEGKVGGRFYERTPDGREYDWGEVVTWEPPTRLAYNWYLGSSAELPSRVDVRFIALGPDSTQVNVVHSGPEYIGELWAQRSSSYENSWQEVLASYVAICQK